MKSITLRLFILFLFTFLHADIGLDYLNSLRTNAALPAFTAETSLNNSSKNHSDYMQTNTIFSHEEDSAKSGYTGDHVSNRAVYAGYQHMNVSENISAGQISVQDSIDGLMSAIYHRFGFLSLEVDEIGIGITNDYYTYDMGNSRLSDLCTNEAYTGGDYYLPCADNTIKVEKNDYEGRADTIKSASPELIRWPYMSASDIPPVFYEEYPDPLPSDSVTGYPVSVEFNNAMFSSVPTVDSFVLKDADAVSLPTLISMDESNDPNGKFSAYQFALFPKERLEWGSMYTVDFSYTYEDVSYTRNWCFSTRSLNNIADKFYRIDNDQNVSFQVVSGKSYAIYVLPMDTNDTLGSVTYNYTTEEVPHFSYIDANTILVTLTGKTEEFATFSFENNQTIKLTIDTADTADVPSAMKCSQVTDNDYDGYSDIDENSAGSNPFDANDKPLDTDGDMIPNFRDADDDNDGISDSDELANGLNPLNASDGQADFDGDGFSNAVEISIGTDIRDKTSKPIWAPVMIGDILVLIPSVS